MLKFLTLKGGEERSQLIPVLTTILRFSPDECALLTSVAKGALLLLRSASFSSSGSEQAAAANSSNWASYLHRWSGTS